MSLWSAIVLIVLIVTIGQYLRTRHDRRDGLYTDKTGSLRQRPTRDTAEEERLRAEVAELKDRVKVLERIATDERQKLGLAEEIELLRDK